MDFFHVTNTVTNKRLKNQLLLMIYIFLPEMKQNKVYYHSDKQKMFEVKIGCPSESD